MKSNLINRTVLACLIALAALTVRADEEQDLIAKLQSAASIPEKCSVCQKLRTVGTAKSVPALAALLGEERVGHAARYALEAMPGPEAGAALRAALSQTSGLIKAGVVDSLGWRREPESLPLLVPLLSDPDATIASASAAALGRIGGKEAIAALTVVRDKAPPAVQTAAIESLLQCAEQLLAAGDASGAATLYRGLFDAKFSPDIRAAAWRGLALADGGQRVELITKALAGTDRPTQIAALKLIRELNDPRVIQACVRQWAALPAESQLAVLDAHLKLGAAALPTVRAATESPFPAVRVAAWQALESIGDASAVPLLIDAAVKATGAEKDSPRAALARMTAPGVDSALVAQLKSSQPAVQAEVTRALASRRAKSAVPALLAAAQSGDDAMRIAVAGALGELAGDEAVAPMVQLLRNAKTDASREALVSAVGLICGRSQKPEALAPAVLAAMNGADILARCALLRVVGRCGGADALQALRAAAHDKDATIQDAAIRSLADGGGLDAAPDLLKLAKESGEMTHRVLAYRGYWRVVGLAGERPLEVRWQLCEAGLSAAPRAEDKKLGVTELARLPTTAALKLAETLCADDAVQAEAEDAVVRIATALASTNTAEAKAALQHVASASKNEKIQTAARQALGEMDKFVGFITAWLVSGPYRQAGKQCQELFDIAFAPEEDAVTGVNWKPAPVPKSAAESWWVDLLSIVGEEQSVAYLKTRVYSPKEQKVRLEIGSDDGNKVWVNGQLVHAKNVLRAIQPGDDKADALLREGWNDFKVKITQNIMGCGVCIRLRNVDGSTVDGLRVDVGGK